MTPRLRQLTMQRRALRDIVDVHELVQMLKLQQVGAFCTTQKGRSVYAAVYAAHLAGRRGGAA